MILHSPVLKAEMVGSSEKWVSVYQSSPRHISEGSGLYYEHCDSLRCHPRSDESKERAELESCR